MARYAQTTCKYHPERGARWTLVKRIGDLAGRDQLCDECHDSELARLTGSVNSLSLVSLPIQRFLDSVGAP